MDPPCVLAPFLPTPPAYPAFRLSLLDAAARELCRVSIPRFDPRESVSLLRDPSPSRSPPSPWRILRVTTRKFGRQPSRRRLRIVLAVLCADRRSRLSLVIGKGCSGKRHQLDLPSSFPLSPRDSASVASESFTENEESISPREARNARRHVVTRSGLRIAPRLRVSRTRTRRIRRN